MLPRSRRWARPVTAAFGVAGALGVLLGVAAPARADDREAAHQAYDRGTAAFDHQRWAEAAAEFARADALAQSPVALESALKAAVLADDPILALTLADRAEAREGKSPSIVAAAQRARVRFADRVGKLSIRCAVARCTVNVDADPFPVGQPRWVNVGEHAVEIGVDGRVARYTLTIAGGKTLDFQEPAIATPDPPQAPPPPPVVVAPPPVLAPPPAIALPPPLRAEPPRAEGISPAWFWVGCGVTAAIGAGAIASGVDTLAKHDDFITGRTDDPTSGKAAQTRTNLLFGVTGAAALAVTGVGIFAVQWRSRSPSPVSFELHPTGAALRGRF